MWHDDAIHIATFKHTSILRHALDMIRYLGNVYDFWNSLLEGAADRDTVLFLNQLCPQVGRNIDKIESRKSLLFQNLKPEQQDTALATISKSKIGLIPTLSSFFKSLAYLRHKGRLISKLSDIEDGHRKEHTYEDIMKSVYRGNEFGPVYRKL